MDANKRSYFRNWTPMENEIRDFDTYNGEYEEKNVMAFICRRLSQLNFGQAKCQLN